ncbi:MAG: hypothetical protein SGJ20_07055 [Planctomycetota bacterium]|nr:hypothetical protein [Planctomycetota bacterium]
MQCIYYLAPTLESTHKVSDDLRAAGISDFFLHVISKDEAGLNQQHIHSSNYLETTDIIRLGLIGAFAGFIAGLICAGLLMRLEPFGPDVPAIVFFITVALVTMFGSWVGGLTGIATKNRKLGGFQYDIEAGKYLLLVYARKKQLAEIQTMMSTRHPEAKLSAMDKHFLNPFIALH